MSDAPDPRALLIRLVHVAKRELTIDDPTYRDLALRVTGHRSAADCDAPQLRRLLDEMKRLGFKFRPRNRRPVPRHSKQRMIYGLWSELAPLLDGAAGDKELRAFVRRQTGRDAVEFLDDADANRVIDGLRGWLDRVRRQRPDPQSLQEGYD